MNAILSNVTPQSAQLIVNNGSYTRPFDTNGTFTFILELDGKIGYVEAVVDWISNRESIFEEILAMYEENMCDGFAHYIQDSYNSLYHMDIQTMKNLCIMR